MNVNIIFIIQVRTGSSRLPGKMILPFYQGKTIPEILIERLFNHFPAYPIIIATTDSKSDNDLVKLLAPYPVQIFRGDENNVVKRFLEAGKNYGVDLFVRVCADNPFLDVGLLREMLDRYTPELDYLSYEIDGVPSMKTSYGFFTEISRISALEMVLHKTNDPIHLEHVTNFIYENPTLFKVGFLMADPLLTENRDVRFTVDTQNDFDVAQRAYTDICRFNPAFNFKDLILWANQNNLLKQMITETSKNKK